MYVLTCTTVIFHSLCWLPVTQKKILKINYVTCIMSPAYGVYISQLIRYARACSTYDQFLVRGCLLTNKLMSQGFQLSRLQAAFRKFYGRYNDLICPFNLSLGRMLSDMFLMISLADRRSHDHLYYTIIYYLLIVFVESVDRDWYCVRVKQPRL